MSELGSMVAMNAGRVVDGVAAPPVRPDVGRPAPDGLYLTGVDPYTGMPERPQKYRPQVFAAGAVALRPNLGGE